MCVIEEEIVFFVESSMLSLDHLLVVEVVGVAKDIVLELAHLVMCLSFCLMCGGGQG